MFNFSRVFPSTCLRFGLGLLTALSIVALPCDSQAQSTYTWKSVRIGGFGAIPDLKCVDPDGNGSGKSIYFLTTDVSAFSKWNDNFPNPRWYLQMMFMNDALSNDTYGAFIGVSNNAQVIYATTGKAAYFPTPASANQNKGKLWKSINGGATWSQPNPNFRMWNATNWDQRRGRNRITVDPENSRVVYVASREGLHRSHDGGETWLGNTNAQGLGRADLPAVGGGYIDASDGADPHGENHANGCAWVLVDPNGGTTNVGGPPRSRIVWCCVLDDNLSGAADASHPGGIFINAGVYRSTDGGSTFSKIPGSLDGWSAEIDNFGTVYMVAAVDRGVAGVGPDERGLYRCSRYGTAFTPVDTFDQFIKDKNDRWSLGGISIHRNPASGNTVIAIARQWTFGDTPPDDDIRKGNAIIVSGDAGVAKPTWKFISQAAIDANTNLDSNPASLEGNSYDDPIRDVEFDHADRTGNTLIYAGFLPYRTTELFSSPAPEWFCITQGHEELVSLGGSASPSSGSIRFWSAVADMGGFRHGTNLDVAPRGFRFYGSGPGTVSSLTNCTSIDVSPRDPDVVVLVGRAGHETRSGDTLRRGFITLNGTGASPDFTTLRFDDVPPNAASGKIAISADATKSNPGTLVWAPQKAGGVWYSTDRGANWSRAGTAIPNLIDGDTVFTDYSVPIAADRERANYFYAYDADTGNYYRSTSTLPNFQLIATPVDSGPSGSKFPGTSRPFLRSIYAGSTGTSWVGMSLDNGGLYVSKRWGESRSFVKITAVQRSVAFDFGKAGADGVPAMFVWGRVNGQDGIFRSTNGGTTWVAINAFQGDRPVMYGNTINSLEVVGDKSIFGRVYVGSQSGFFYGEP